MHIAVIVTTYNRTDALGSVLNGYLAQTDQDFELIVADDGSTDATREVIDSYRSKAHFPIRHVWQEDLGFRPSAIRNRAIAATDSEYIVFTDGDCVPAREFVARHRKLMEQGYFLSGNRILLSESFTRRVLENQTPIHEWGIARWLVSRFRGQINRFLPLVSLPGEWRKNSPDKWEGVKTCNLSVWMNDLKNINGFDESYTGWGLEDSDLVIRLLRAGVKHKSARFSSPVFHLWHPDNDRSHLAENDRMLTALIASDSIRAKTGLDQYLP